MIPFMNTIISNQSDAVRIESTITQTNDFIRLFDIAARQVDLRNKDIPKLDRDCFASRIQCEYLNLSKNKLTQLNRLFDSVNNLTSFYLEENQISKIDSDAFSNLYKLTTLDLSSNLLIRIESQLFNNLINLKLLILSNNKITSIDQDSFSTLTHLTELNLSENYLTSINEKLFEKCKKLMILSLSSNKIIEIHKNAFKNIKELVILDVSDNSIEKLDLDFQPSNSALIFNFSFNNIHDASLYFDKNNNNDESKITKINLSSNNIQDITKIKIGSRISKYQINVRFNRVKFVSNEIVKEIISFDNLTFDLRNNALNESSLDFIERNYLNKFQFKSNTLDSAFANDKMINKMDFQLFEHSNKWIKRFNEWEKISNFSVITGKNGVGKSTVLTYFKDVINEFYKAINLYFSQSIDQTKKDKLITQIKSFNNFINILEDLKQFRTNHLYIPVVYKMHDTIKPDMVGLNELKSIVNSFLFEFDKSTLKESFRYASDYYKKSIDIFSAKSIEELILQFRNKEKFINQHLSDFKYEIRIYDENPPRIKFKERIQENSDINPDELDASNLSPGEQLMLMFRLWEFALTRFEIPHTPVLLLDEPDAHLHPKAVKDFVLILEKLANSGAQIIMTTHNPTTVSLVNKENLFCMKKISKGFVSIESTQLKTEIIRELTDNLIVVTEPYRVVLVEGASHAINLMEPEYMINERDANFYRFVYTILIKKSLENPTSTSVSNKFKGSQLVFKSFSGHDDILDFLKRIDKALMYQDHCAIIDNDNFFEISSNQPEVIREYYENRSKRRFNLLRHSLENYILDPINLFVFLNFYSKQHSSISRGIQDDRVEVNLSNLENFHKKIAKIMNIDFKEFQDNYTQIIKEPNLEEHFNLFKAVIIVLASDLIEYLTQIDGFGYRIFKHKKELGNLMPILRYFPLLKDQSIKQKKKNTDNANNSASTNNADETDDLSYFCSVNLVKKAKTMLLIAKLKEDLRLGILNDSTNEIDSKAKELNDVNDSFVDDAKNNKGLFKNSKIKECLEMHSKKISDTFQLVLTSKEFREFVKSKEIKDQNDLKLELLDFIKNNSTILESIVTQQQDEGAAKKSKQTDEKPIDDIINNLELYIDSTFLLDQQLIKNLKDYLAKTEKCCFYGQESQVFEYPLVFYKLRGHYLEKVIYGMFFRGKYFESKLIRDLLKDNGVLTRCGYLVPNELSEIFNKIENLNTTISQKNP